jgi:hypothetical protein
MIVLVNRLPHQAPIQHIVFLDIFSFMRPFHFADAPSGVQREREREREETSQDKYEAELNKA